MGVGGQKVSDSRLLEGIAGLKSALITEVHISRIDGQILISRIDRQTLISRMDGQTRTSRIDGQTLGILGSVKVILRSEHGPFGPIVRVGGDLRALVLCRASRASRGP